MVVRLKGTGNTMSLSSSKVGNKSASLGNGAWDDKLRGKLIILVGEDFKTPTAIVDSGKLKLVGVDSREAPRAGELLAVPLKPDGGMLTSHPFFITLDELLEWNAEDVRLKGVRDRVKVLKSIRVVEAAVSK